MRHGDGYKVEESYFGDTQSYLGKVKPGYNSKKMVWDGIVGLVFVVRK